MLETPGELSARHFAFLVAAIRTLQRDANLCNADMTQA
jgi:hypothetical protein